MSASLSNILADILAPNLDVVFCGINPGLSAAAAGHHFLGRGNRFWRVLHQSGFTAEEIRPESDRTILQYGCGLTALVERPTSGAHELRPREFTPAAAALEQKIAACTPRFIAILGKAPFATISSVPKIDWGPQARTFGGAKVWILPNPSGRNRAFNLGRLVDSYRDLRLAVSGSAKKGG